MEVRGQACAHSSRLTLSVLIKDIVAEQKVRERPREIQKSLVFMIVISSFLGQYISVSIYIQLTRTL